MTGRTKAENVGLSLDANLLNPKEVNGLDKYFALDSEVSELQTTANNALNTAQNAVDRLAGDADYWQGEFLLYTSTDPAIPPTPINVTSQGISWTGDGRKWNFSYLGWYLIIIKTSGDITNARTDWYQEFTARVKQNGVILNDESITIPPSMTKNIRARWVVPVKVAMGDVISWDWIHGLQGSLNVGCRAYITIKKVI